MALMSPRRRRANMTMALARRRSGGDKSDSLSAASSIVFPLSIAASIAAAARRQFGFFVILLPISLAFSRYDTIYAL